MSTIIQAIIGFFSQGIGSKIGNATANVASIAALAPVAYWLIENRESSFIVISYGDMAFWGGIMFVLIKVVHYTRAGNPNNREQ